MPNLNLNKRVALRVIRPHEAGTRSMHNALVALPDGTVIAGVMSLTIDQGAIGQSPILTLRIVDFDVEIEGQTNRWGESRKGDPKLPPEL